MLVAALIGWSLWPAPQLVFPIERANYSYVWRAWQSGHVRAHVKDHHYSITSNGQGEQQREVPEESEITKAFLAKSLNVQLLLWRTQLVSWLEPLVRASAGVPN